MRGATGPASVALQSLLDFLKCGLVNQRLMGALNLEYFSLPFTLRLDLNCRPRPDPMTDMAYINGVFQQVMYAGTRLGPVGRGAAPIDIISQVSQRVAATGVHAEHFSYDRRVLVRLQAPAALGVSHIGVAKGGFAGSPPFLCPGSLISRNTEGNSSRLFFRKIH